MSGYCDQCGNTQCICPTFEQMNALLEQNKKLETSVQILSAYDDASKITIAKFKQELAFMDKAFAKKNEELAEALESCRIAGRDLASAEAERDHALESVKMAVKDLETIIKWMPKDYKFEDFNPSVTLAKLKERHNL